MLALLGFYFLLSVVGGFALREWCFLSIFTCIVRVEQHWNWRCRGTGTHCALDFYQCIYGNLSWCMMSRICWLAPKEEAWEHGLSILLESDFCIHVHVQRTCTRGALNIFPALFGGSSTMTRCLFGHSNIRACRKLNVRHTSFRKQWLKVSIFPARALDTHAVASFISLSLPAFIFAVRLGRTCWIAAASRTMTAFASGNWRHHWHLRL